LFTISLFLIKREAKEIGVRKVLGAFNHQIVTYYLLKFLKIIVPSMIISLAIGYYALVKFCQLYPNHIDINIFVHLLLPAVVIMSLSVLIITSSAGFIANINPARTTKYE
jgi:putative ABC transport system permease protein